MNVLQVLLGQSASVMQPEFAVAPPTKAPVSQVPDVGQSASLQHGVLAASGARQRPVSLTHVPVPPHASVLPQPAPPVQLAPGVVPPEHRIGMRSPVRKIRELSGRLRFVVLPAAQSPLPEAFAVIVLITHMLNAAPLCEAFGIGSGGPKRHPVEVHVPSLPVSAWVVE